MLLNFVQHLTKMTASQETDQLTFTLDLRSFVQSISHKHRKSHEERFKASMSLSLFFGCEFTPFLSHFFNSMCRSVCWFPSAHHFLLIPTTKIHLSSDFWNQLTIVPLSMMFTSRLLFVILSFWIGHKCIVLTLNDSYKKYKPRGFSKKKTKFYLGVGFLIIILS